MIFLNRIDIFKELSLNELQEYDSSTAENLIGNYYDQFSEFCSFLHDNITIGEVENEEGEMVPIVKSVSCNIGDDGVRFEMEMINGQRHEVFMSKERESEFKEQRIKEINEEK